MGVFKDGALLERTTSTATSVGTVTLTVTSTTYQRFTGSTSGQIVKLPAANTLTVGQKYVVQNRSTAPITVNDGASALVFLLPTGQDRTFQVYSVGSIAGTWDVSNSATSGGGGGSLQWIEDGNSPTPALDSVNNRIYNYQSTLAQSLYTVIKVPKSYSVGDQILLLLPFYANNTNTGNALLQTTTTLIRPGSDLFSSTTNQRVSTNATVINPTANVPQTVSFDLTDTSGNINSTSVAASNLILLTLSRATPTGTDISNDLSVLVYAAEVIF